MDKLGISSVLLSMLVISSISMRLNMLDYLYALSLLSITITLFYLTRSCFQFKGEIPHQGDEISQRIDKVHGVLDEMMDFAADLAETLPQSSSSISHTPPDFLSLLTAFLKPATPSPVEHGDKTQQEEREIFEVIPPENKEE